MPVKNATWATVTATHYTLSIISSEREKRNKKKSCNKFAHKSSSIFRIKFIHDSSSDSVPAVGAAVTAVDRCLEWKYTFWNDAALWSRLNGWRMEKKTDKMTMKRWTNEQSNWICALEWSPRQSPTSFTYMQMNWMESHLLLQLHLHLHLRAHVTPVPLMWCAGVLLFLLISDESTRCQAQTQSNETNPREECIFFRVHIWVKLTDRMACVVVKDNGKLHFVFITVRRDWCSARNNKLAIVIWRAMHFPHCLFFVDFSDKSLCFLLFSFNGWWVHRYYLYMIRMCVKSTQTLLQRPLSCMRQMRNISAGRWSIRPGHVNMTNKFSQTNARC